VIVELWRILEGPGGCGCGCGCALGVLPFWWFFGEEELRRECGLRCGGC